VCVDFNGDISNGLAQPLRPEDQINLPITHTHTHTLRETEH